MSRGRKKDKRKEKGSLKRDIIQLVQSGSTQGYDYKEIAARLNLTEPSGRNAIIKALQELEKRGVVKELESGRYTMKAELAAYEGVVQINLQGNGYVLVPDLEKDIFVPYGKLNKAFNGDKVLVQVEKTKRSGALEGRIREIISRKRTKFVGVLDLYKDFAFVKPKDAKVYKDFYVSLTDTLDAQNGDSVMVEFIGWPERSDSPEAKVLQTFGIPGEHATEMHTILGEYGLPYAFDPQISKEAESLDLTITQADVDARKDLRDVLTFTIDPRDAKDFDDALSYRELDEGMFEVGVHIADVSHYVAKGTLLDDEAFERGTSVYLVDRVVPMLPEVLSNEACSLRPNEDKLTFSIIFNINIEGIVKSHWIGRTVIHSNQRFSYEEAQHIIESGAGDIPETIALSGMGYTVSTDIVRAVDVMDRIAKKLRNRRMNEGAISFDKIEVKFDLNEQYEPIGVYFKEQKESNKLIEEFMLLANRNVADFIGKSKPPKTFVYRVHDQPDDEKLYALQGIIKRFGYSLDFTNKKALNGSLNDLLEKVKGRGEQNLVDTLAIRSMSKAAYTTQNIGHYGLAFDYYTHFTSPIRRYPDIMVHRLLQHYLDKGSSPNAEEFELQCKHGTDREILASSAERDSIKYMQVKFMESRKNIPFKGVISGVTEWGIYVELLENKCEGMVRIRDIKGDFFTYDDREYALIGDRTGIRYQLGDEVMVEVKHTDVLKRHLDFRLIEGKKLARKMQYT